ncbi:hypothetical protein [Streptomyces goshikiensis]|uniref:hypothetical protein n=1 Tax=Streptomyces goshikiensis TaxID=1942 RepID=UPI002AE0ABE3|nr:hypothetical protein [Streptomyces goshikiensis]
MAEPVDPVLLFDARGHMFVLPDPVVADELIETVEEFFEGFDGGGRPLRAIGPSGQIELVLASEEPRASELRARVAHYYFVYAARHPTRIPPQEDDLTAFIQAVADDEVDE